MTTIASILLLIIRLTMALKSMNPIKVRISVLIARAIIFLIMRTITGTSWFPLVLIVLFIGGIIMIFIILSSILPNEKRLKRKFALVIILTSIILLTSRSWALTAERVSFNRKIYLSRRINFFVVMAIILFYFLARIRVLRSEKTPMRRVTCY